VFRSVDAATLRPPAEPEPAREGSPEAGFPAEYGSSPLFHAFRETALGESPATAAPQSAIGVQASPSTAGIASTAAQRLLPLQRLPDGAANSGRADPGIAAPAWTSPEMPLATPSRLEQRQSPRSGNPGSNESTIHRSSAGDATGTSLPLVQPLIPDQTGASPAAIQREVTTDEVTAQVSAAEAPGSTDPDLLQKLDVDELTERVWSRIRRKLRVERERSRGIV
jgi:hypothetical protein